MKNKAIEIGFLYLDQLYVFRAVAPDPLAHMCEPGSGFKKMSVLEAVHIDCVIKPQGEHTGEVVASWNRIEKRLIDAAPTEGFVFQPDQGAEQEELFNRLLITCEQSVREAILREAYARENSTGIPEHRKHLS